MQFSWTRSGRLTCRAAARSAAAIAFVTFDIALVPAQAMPTTQAVMQPAREAQPAATEPPAQGTPAQTERLIAGAQVIDIREGQDLHKSQWTLTAGLNPDTYTVGLEKGERREVCFISGAHSLCRTVGVGDQYDFIIIFAGVEYPTRVVGMYVPPMAVFDEAYQATHRGKVRLAIPEVYELVNIAIALTATAQQDLYLVVKDTPYYQEAMRHFAGVKDHPFVLALDQELRQNRSRYFPLKMNAYAFEFGDGDRIVRSRVYDRTGFSGSKVNDLVPYLSHMQDFSDKSGFRAFFAAHATLYQSHIDEYRTGIDLDGMVAWLRTNFPDVTPYDTVNIVFSPLVGANQSVTWMESNGFSELQPHVNFPYRWPGIEKTYSPAAVALRLGFVIFTELNHGFINPTAELFAPRIAAALDDRNHWLVNNDTTSNYGDAVSVFNEMMNWGLISVYLVDKAPPADLPALLAELGQTMGSQGRGFRQSPRFHRFLVDLYRNRPPGATLASLYPEIVEWFEAQRHDPFGKPAASPGARN